MSSPRRGFGMLRGGRMAGSKRRGSVRSGSVDGPAGDHEIPDPRPEDRQVGQADGGQSQKAGQAVSTNASSREGRAAWREQILVLEETSADTGTALDDQSAERTTLGDKEFHMHNLLTSYPSVLRAHPLLPRLFLLPLQLSKRAT